MRFASYSCYPKLNSLGSERGKRGTTPKSAGILPMAAKLVKKHLNASARSKLKHPSVEKDKEQERELKTGI